MFEIEITNDAQKMSEIGRVLFKKRRLFTNNQVEVVKDTIKRFLPKASEEELDNFFFRYYYDYIMYGFAAEQEFGFRLLNKTHEEKSQYITQQSRYLFYARLNKRDSMHILEDKYEAYKLLKDYYRREVIKVVDDSDYDAFISFIERHPIFVVKPFDLSNGMGVQKIDSNAFNSKRDLFNYILGISDAFDKSQDYKWSNVRGAVLEEIIIQDDSLNVMNPSSVNGIRLTTIRVNGDIHIYYPWIKVGSGGAFVVSAILGGFDACINAETGIVETDGFLESGKSIQYHPDTNCRIKGFQIPKWDELIELAKEVASKMDSTINYVGWDFVLTPNGWVIMEGNFYGDVMWQMCYGKGMKEDLENLIGWKMEKKYWWQYTLAELEQ